MRGKDALRLDNTVIDMQRWDILDDFLVKGKRYLFTFYDGQVLEADYSMICFPEDDLEMHVKNSVDRSPNPQFRDAEIGLINCNDIASIEEVS